MKIYVINLDRDSHRWSAISAALAKHENVSLERVSGVYGPNLPVVAIEILGGHIQATRHRGTMGAFISHVKAWEAVAESAEPYGVVLEDDAVLIGFDRILSLSRPDDADLIFLNDRMSPGSRYSPRDAPIHCADIAESLRTLNKSGFGVGGDGYLLTKRGAGRLLQAVSKDLLFGHVDWRLLRYCLKATDLEGEMKDTRVAQIVLHHHNPKLPPSWSVIKAYCLSTPIVAFATGGDSTRMAGDEPA